ncbi:hypothetical protein Fcan01_11796 [Folsomia candida]|uniref:Uncharacterized protein n=1 Tax=Folsomia candida TaxID=158441 RepID=A0A226E701_FOLCA|nr:hypothetical protein Fcan01_11796 [Folsomia candida]
MPPMTPESIPKKGQFGILLRFTPRKLRLIHKRGELRLSILVHAGLLKYFQDFQQFLDFLFQEAHMILQVKCDAHEVTIPPSKFRLIPKRGELRLSILVHAGLLKYFQDFQQFLDFLFQEAHMILQVKCDAHEVTIPPSKFRLIPKRGELRLSILVHAGLLKYFQDFQQFLDFLFQEAHTILHVIFDAHKVQTPPSKFRLIPKRGELRLSILVHAGLLKYFQDFQQFLDFLFQEAHTILHVIFDAHKVQTPPSKFRLIPKRGELRLSILVHAGLLKYFQDFQQFLDFLFQEAHTILHVIFDAHKVQTPPSKFRLIPKRGELRLSILVHAGLLKYFQDFQQFLDFLFQEAHTILHVIFDAHKVQTPPSKFRLIPKRGELRLSILVHAGLLKYFQYFQQFLDFLFQEAHMILHVKCVYFGDVSPSPSLKNPLNTNFN